MQIVQVLKAIFQGISCTHVCPFVICQCYYMIKYKSYRKEQLYVTWVFMHL